MTLVVTNTTNLERALQPDSNFWQDSARTTSASATDPVGAWDDQSGNGYHVTQGTTSKKPTLGSDLVTFDGTDDVLDLGNSIASTYDSLVFTIYLVVDPNNVENSDYIWGIKKSTEFIYLQIKDQSGSLDYQIGSKLNGVTNTDTSSGNEASDGLQVLCIKSSTSTITLYQNGTSVVSASHNATTFASNPDENFLGTLRNNGNYAGMDLVAYYEYSATHSDSDRGDIEDELTAEYIDTTQTASPNAIAVTATVQQPSVIGPGQTTSPDSIAITATVEQPTVIGPNQTASPDAIAITATVEQPTVSTAGSLQTANPSAIAITATVEQPTVTSIVTASPDSIAITATVEQPSVTTGAVTVSPDTIAITATVEQPTVIGPVQTASPNAIAITATVEQPTVTNIVQGEVYSGSIAVSYPYAGSMAVTYPYSGTIEVA